VNVTPEPLVLGDGPCCDAPTSAWLVAKVGIAPISIQAASPTAIFWRIIVASLVNRSRCRVVVERT
jgi:hypothetical protein